ncbi:unnamed protein product [Tilletia laevis]|uniref:NADAR domain-containing protein n=1 Tax=Tilletia laevis TaxID=157183 RepID=A0A9N8M1J0_9BASI|nr:hypothetical protein CF328_g7034 [Tilletia controversa]CAD6886729.1 unnamed protein product [Tilletia caries]CAD6939939.1 unnamed protein product [Tilletia laevis]CAD6942385.1 unnamed protein product [Tilletia controversa]
MSMVTVSAPSSNSPHPTSAYAIVHQVQDKRCALCSTPLGDVGFYRCESKDWTCPSCVAKDSAQIRFWERMKPYHWLASYYPSPVVYKKLLFRNVAVLFQACKFNTPQRFMEVARETSAERAFNKAKSLEKEVRSDWPAIKMQVMTFCQYLKFSQNKNLGLWLVHTSNARLVECSDAWWGEGGGRGENNLGRALQEVRKLLKDQGPAPKDLVAIKIP